MHKYLIPFDEANFDQVLSEMKQDPEVEIVSPDLIYYGSPFYSYKPEVIKFKTKTPLTKEEVAYCEWFQGHNCYIRYSLVALAKKGKDFRRHCPSPFPKFSEDLISSMIKLPSEFTYEIEGKVLTLPKTKVLEIAQTRVRNLAESVFNVLHLSELGSYYTLEEGTKNLIIFLTEMTEHYWWEKELKGQEKSKLKELEKEFKDKKFIAWWLNKHKITLVQLACEHDDSDQFADDGHWYNSVGTCKKCLLNTDKVSFDSSDCQDAFEVWSAAKKAYFSKKLAR